MGGTEDRIEDGEQTGKVPVVVLAPAGMMDSVELRRVQNEPGRAEAQAQVHVSDVVPESQHAVYEHDPVIRPEQQPDHEIDRCGLDGLLGPEMSLGGGDVHCPVAMMKRVHRPKHRETVLRAVEPVLTEIHCERVESHPEDQAPARGRQSHKSAAKSVGRRHGQARDPPARKPHAAGYKAPDTID